MKEAQTTHTSCSTSFSVVLQHKVVHCLQSTHLSTTPIIIIIICLIISCHRRHDGGFQRYPVHIIGYGSTGEIKNGGCLQHQLVTGVREQGHTMSMLRATDVEFLLLGTPGPLTINGTLIFSSYGWRFSP